MIFILYSSSSHPHDETDVGKYWHPHQPISNSLKVRPYVRRDGSVLFVSLGCIEYLIPHNSCRGMLVESTCLQ